MVTNDEGLVHFKHNIMEEVCRLAWASNLNEETKAELVEKIIPGPKPLTAGSVWVKRVLIHANSTP